MQAIIQTIEHLYQPRKAVEIAAMMNADPDDDFSYVVVHDPKGVGYSYIKVIDEDGFYIAKL